MNLANTAEEERFNGEVREFFAAELPGRLSDKRRDRDVDDQSRFNCTAVSV
ncbi:hypothetical protein [Sulfitobacter sp. EhC04]|uniref:hypothetical protein n=1 Tax=Sulfitobacter sp. EhC04 TaxID=1849168 RepID=UPI001373180A|nr:hypothetical protein [Sulfitobacter sp. EhC04]